MTTILQEDIYNESEIIAQIKTGDIDSFCKLVEKYNRRTLSIAYSFCSNYEDAKDLSQEAFIKAFRSIKKFKGRSKFYTWFHRILINICKDFLRSKKADKVTVFSLKFRNRDDAIESEDIFEHIASNLPGPEKLLLNKELGEKLTKAISSLPKMQKIIFTLKNIQRLSISEIAEITNCAMGTVKSHLFRATANLQTKLEKYKEIDIYGGVK